MLYSCATFAALSFKTQIQGLIDRQNTQWINQDEGTPEFTMDNVNQFPGLFGGVVINTSWAKLQPSPDKPLDTSTIDTPLQKVRDYNSQHPDHPLAVKLRVWAGANAPEWAKEIDGKPIVIYRNKVGNCTGAPTCPLTVGKFWYVNGGYVQAWRAFQQKLADIYDNEPLIRQVAVTSCTQQTDEPFVSTMDETARNNLRVAGYSDDDQKQCISSAVAMDYKAWKNTLIDFSFGPFTFMDQGKKGQDMAFTLQVMENLPSQAILDAQAVGKQGQTIANTPTFSAIASHSAQGALVNLQTASPNAMGNLPHQPPNMDIWSNTFTMAHDMGATGLEIWSELKNDGFDNMTMEQACFLLTKKFLPGQPIPSPCR